MNKLENPLLNSEESKIHEQVVEFFGKLPPAQYIQLKTLIRNQICDFSIETHNVYAPHLKVTFGNKFIAFHASDKEKFVGFVLGAYYTEVK